MSKHVDDLPADFDTETGGTVVISKVETRRYEVTPTRCDQRKSYRYPAQHGQNAATIRHRRKSSACTLKEESAGGVAIELSAQFAVEVNDEVELELYSGWYRARVVHVQPGEDGKRHVGLQRIAAIAEAGTGDAKSTKSNEDSILQYGLRKVLMMVVVAGVAMLAGGALMNWISGRPLNSIGSPRPVQISAGYSERPGSAPLSGLLDSVNTLNQPEVAKELRISKEQRSTLDSIFVGASNRLGDLHEKTKDQPPEIWYQQSQAVVNDALENILCSLTDEQIAQWRSILINQRQANASG